MLAAAAPPRRHGCALRYATCWSAHRLPPPERADRLALAQAMVRVSSIAADLIADERAADASLEPPRRRSPRSAGAPGARARAPAFGTSTDRIARLARHDEAISFPRFVTDLINGVFKSMNDSSPPQMQMFLQLLNDVSSSADGFERSQSRNPRGATWVVDHFPDPIEYGAPRPNPRPARPGRLATTTAPERSASMPAAEELRAVLGAGPQTSTPATPSPWCRSHAARSRGNASRCWRRW